MGRIKGKMQYGSMTPRILEVCASVANRNLLFSVAQARQAMQRQYPDFFTLYSSKFASQLSAMRFRGYLESVEMEGIPVTGVYRIAKNALEEIKKCLVDN